MNIRKLSVGLYHTISTNLANL